MCTLTRTPAITSLVVLAACVAAARATRRSELPRQRTKEPTKLPTGRKVCLPAFTVEKGMFIRAFVNCYLLSWKHYRYFIIHSSLRPVKRNKQKFSSGIYVSYFDCLVAGEAPATTTTQGHVLPASVIATCRSYLRNRSNK